jgi:hypothetical protein
MWTGPYVEAKNVTPCPRDPSTPTSNELWQARSAPAITQAIKALFRWSTEHFLPKPNYVGIVLNQAVGSQIELSIQIEYKGSDVLNDDSLLFTVVIEEIALG